MTAVYVGRFGGRENSGPRGTRMCQCPLCSELFSCESNFILHRIEGRSVGGSPGAYFLGECRHPASKGMALSGAGVWYQPRISEVPLPVRAEGANPGKLRAAEGLVPYDLTAITEAAAGPPSFLISGAVTA